jgi:hypothetical protein
VPEHYGEFRVGAVGEDWHSGLPQIVTPRDWRTKQVRVALDLAAEHCDHATGQVVTTGDSPVSAARLESTHFGATVYTAPDGRFDTYVPFDTTQTARQFIVTSASLRPEVIPLEARANGSPGVSGTAPSGPFKVTMAGRVEVELSMPKEAVHLAPYQLMQPGANLTLEGRDAALVNGVKLPCGMHCLPLTSVEHGTMLTLWIDDDAWERAFRAYATGSTEAARMNPEPLEDAFKRR